MSEPSNKDIAGAVIASIEGHGQFVATLALAVSAGIFAFAFQIILNNSKGDGHAIQISCSFLLLLSILLNFLSVTCWYFVKSTLVAATPAIYTFEWSGNSTTAVFRKNGFGFVTTIAFLQVLLFGASLVLLIVCLALNFHLLNVS
jgi:hypothetical protein